MKRAAFIAAVGVQLLILVLVPYKKLMAWKYGEEIVLAARLYDPFDPFRGYHVAMEYEAGRPPRVGQATSRFTDGDRIYVRLERDSAGISRPAEYQSMRSGIPLGSRFIFISGIFRHGRIEYGLEKYYIPETRRKDVELALAATRGETFPIHAHVKVDSDGNSILMAIEVSGKRFEF